MTRKMVNSRERLPRPVFKSLAHINRIKNFMLGLPVTRGQGRFPPYGYVAKEADENYYYPIDEHLKLILQASELVKTCSYNEVSEWLSRKTGRRISHQGLFKLFRERHPVKEVLLPYDERLRLASATEDSFEEEEAEAEEVTDTATE